MKVTPRVIITDAFRALSVLRPGQGPNDDAMDEALRMLNDLLDAWQLERLMICGVSETAYTIPSGTLYTLGPGGTMGSTAPVRIENAGWLDAAATSCSGASVPVLTDDEYRKGMQGIWSDNGYPLATLKIRPAPTAGAILNLWAWAPITSFAHADESHNLPPGYAKALRWNLACEMAPSALIQRKIPDVLYQSIERYAIESKATIKSFRSSPPPVMSGDPALSCGGGYDICTDTYHG